jgi:hypothetical protein
VLVRRIARRAPTTNFDTTCDRQTQVNEAAAERHRNDVSPLAVSRAQQQGALPGCRQSVHAPQRTKQCPHLYPSSHKALAPSLPFLFTHTHLLLSLTPSRKKHTNNLAHHQPVCVWNWGASAARSRQQ